MHIESEIFSCVFPFFRIPHPIQMHTTDAKTQKIKPDPNFFWRTKISEAVCKRDWQNVRSYLFFVTFQMKISDSVCRDLNTLQYLMSNNYLNVIWFLIQSSCISCMSHINYFYDKLMMLFCPSTLKIMAIMFFKKILYGLLQYITNAVIWVLNFHFKVKYQFKKIVFPKKIKFVENVLTSAYPSWVGSSTDLKKCSITSLAHQWILCSEWVPSEWESKQLIKTSQ